MLSAPPESERLGVVLSDPLSQVERLEGELREAVTSKRAAEREAEYFAYHILSGTPEERHDPPFQDRLRAVRRSRDLWKRDPLAGRGIKLLCDFVLGGGIAKPRAKDETVQEVLDDFWDSPQSQRVLTSVIAQRALVTSLAVQSNYYLLVFDDGEDSKIEVSNLAHDTVSGVYPNPENRHHIFYFIAREAKPGTWDWENAMEVRSGDTEIVYYEAHDAQEDDETKLPEIPTNARNVRAGEGKVFHVAINRDSEMYFGWPELARILTWSVGFNEVAAARIDVMKAAASIIAKRKVKGGQRAVDNMARRRLTRQTELGVDRSEDDPTPGPRAGSIYDENESVELQPFSINTGSQQAQSDAEMVRSQIAAGLNWPTGYVGGDPGPLAGATSLELTAIANIRAFQRIVEGIYRHCFDRAIERAVDQGKVKRDLAREELDRLSEAQPDQADDERDTGRDLSYEFRLPNPLKRQMADLVNAASTVAKTFDPNNTNVELSKLLFAIVLGEAFEMEDVSGSVEKVFPPGYDPLAALRGGPGQPDGGGAAGTEGADGEQHTENNPYGAVTRSQYPEEVQQARVMIPSGRWGQPLAEAVANSMDDIDRMARDPAVVEAAVARAVKRAQQRGGDEAAAEVDAAFGELEREMEATGATGKARSNGHH